MPSKTVWFSDPVYIELTRRVNEEGKNFSRESDRLIKLGLEKEAEKK